MHSFRFIVNSPFLDIEREERAHREQRNRAGTTTAVVVDGVDDVVDGFADEL